MYSISIIGHAVAKRMKRSKQCFSLTCIRCIMFAFRPTLDTEALGVGVRLRLLHNHIKLDNKVGLLFSICYFLLELIQWNGLKSGPQGRKILLSVHC